MLDERLNRRMKKRVESEDYRVCAAHDLAPIFEKALGINPKELAKSQEFLARVDTEGLKGGAKWLGLKKMRTFGPKQTREEGEEGSLSFSTLPYSKAWELKALKALLPLDSQTPPSTHLHQTHARMPSHPDIFSASITD
jgi:hypothetical protein